MKYLFENLHKIGFYTSFVEILDVVILHGSKEILMKAIQIFFLDNLNLENVLTLLSWTKIIHLIWVSCIIVSTKWRTWFWKILEKKNLFFTAMTMFHQGTDAAAFEYVKVMSPQGKAYHCDFPIQLIDNEEYLSTIECQEGWIIL